MRFRQRRRIPVILNLVPLVDAVLLLLIFFMISSSFVAQPGIKVNLPKAVTAERKEPEDITLAITKEDILYLNNQRIALQDLWGRLLHLQNQGRVGFLIIKADKAVSHGRVVEVMDIAKQAGVERLAIATEPKKAR
jgi:biopolymer transport protein ExbD